MIEERPRTHYEVLDIPMNATPEIIREAYVRAKNAYSSSSLATYSLFSESESKEIIEEIEVAYQTLSDTERRKRYDREHGFMVASSDRIVRTPQESMMLEEGEEVADIGFKDEPDELISDHEHSVNILRMQSSFDFNIDSDKSKISNIATSWGNSDSPTNSIQSVDEIAFPTPTDSFGVDLGNSESEVMPTNAEDEFQTDANAPDVGESILSVESEETESSLIHEISPKDEPYKNVAPISTSTNEQSSLSGSLSTPVNSDSNDPSLRIGMTNHFALHGHYIQKPERNAAEANNFEEIVSKADLINGEFLKKIRECKGVTIDEIMEFTKLSRKYVEALERDDLDKLPAPVYVRGFITQYAKALRLDTKIVAAGYMRSFQDLRESRGLR